MKKKKWLTLFCAACLTVSLAGCGSDTAVYVQSVETLMNLGGIAPGDRFQGLVVSENVTQIKKDSDKSVKELLVKEGDDVQEGQALFSYDTEELQLALDKQKLEKEQLLSSIDNYKSQIETLENALNTVGGTTKLQYTIEIQSTQVDLKEAEIKLKTKEAEVKKSEELLENATVVSPIQGRIQTISESGTDQNGNTLPYITIQQIGSYRVKGTPGELQRGGLREGDRVKILSRTDDSVSWAGTVTLADYENPSQGTDYDRYYGSSSDEMTSSSKYPFYVELDSTDGLMLGQHVYMELEAEEDEAAEGSLGGKNIFLLALLLILVVGVVVFMMLAMQKDDSGIILEDDSSAAVSDPVFSESSEPFVSEEVSEEVSENIEISIGDVSEETSLPEVSEEPGEEIPDEEPFHGWIINNMGYTYLYYGVGVEQFNYSN